MVSATWKHYDPCQIRMYNIWGIDKIHNPNPYLINVV